MVASFWDLWLVKHLHGWHRLTCWRHMVPRLYSAVTLKWPLCLAFPVPYRYGIIPRITSREMPRVEKFRGSDWLKKLPSRVSKFWLTFGCVLACWAVCPCVHSFVSLTGLMLWWWCSFSHALKNYSLPDGDIFFCVVNAFFGDVWGASDGFFC